MGAKYSTLPSATDQANKANCIHMQHFHLQKLLDQDILNHEKIKTEIVEHK